MTNLKKLATWHTDIYNSMSDDECLVCLTQKQRYLLGNALEQMRWGTRWIIADGDVLPDIDAIASELDYKMSDEGCIDFCQWMIDCLENEESGVRQAFYNALGINDLENAIASAKAQALLPMGDGNNPTCNLDAWWSACLQLVQRMHRVNEDILELFEVITNQFELASQVIGAITGVDEASIDAVLNWIAFIQQSIKENYDAQYSVAYEETLACEIFCLAIDQCELTPEMVFDVFSDRLSSAITINSLFEDAIVFLISGSWAGTEIADAMFASQVFFRGLLGRFARYVAFVDWDVAVRLGFNNPDSDWTVLCPTCPSEYTIVQFCDGFGYDDRWNSVYGSYNATEDDWDGQDVGTTITARGWVDLPVGATVTKVVLEWRSSQAQGRSHRISKDNYPFGTGYTTLAIVSPSDADQHGTLTWEGSEQTDKIGVSVDADDTGVAQIECIRITYEITT